MKPETALPWRVIAQQGRLPHGQCVIVRFRLTPNSSKDAVEGLETVAEGLAFKARVTAVPEDGKANAALLVLAAKWLGISKSSVSLAQGGKSRIKMLALAGNIDDLETKLNAKFAEAQTITKT